MAPQSFQLVMRSGPNPGRTFELDKSEISIGRDIANEIVINDAEVSRKHARLVAQSGGYVLQDTGSTNGTFVNGQRLMGPHMLRPGELILLGENVSLAYEATQPDLDATIASGVPAALPTRPAEPYTPLYQEQPGQRPASPPVYSGAIPPGPEEPYAGAQSFPVFDEERRPGRNYRNWGLAGCGCLVILSCLAVVLFLVWVDAGGTERWCEIFGNVIFPSCP